MTPDEATAMRILTDCCNCGHVVSIEPPAARLVVFRTSPHRRRMAGRFGFVCPDCGQPCEAAVSSREEGRLADIGVPVELVDDPRDSHPSTYGRRLRSEAVVDAPPFTEDDVVTLHALLSREDWFDLLLAAG